MLHVHTFYPHHYLHSTSILVLNIEKWKRVASNPIEKASQNLTFDTFCDFQSENSLCFGTNSHEFVAKQIFIGTSIFNVKNFLWRYLTMWNFKQFFFGDFWCDIQHCVPAIIIFCLFCIAKPQYRNSMKEKMTRERQATL